MTSSPRRDLRFGDLAVALIALVALLAGAAAFVAGRIDLAIIAILLVVVGLPVANWIARMRRSLRESERNDDG